VDARRRDCDDAPAIVPLHGVGHGADAKLPGDGSAPCLPSQSRKVYRIIPKYSEARPSTGVPSRIAQVGPQGPPAPVASLRAKGAPRRGRAPPMDYLDNPRSAVVKRSRQTEHQQITAGWERHRQMDERGPETVSESSSASSKSISRTKKSIKARTRAGSRPPCPT
jgi:hypothetical protein